MNESLPATAVSDRNSVGVHNDSQAPKDDRSAAWISADCDDFSGADRRGESNKFPEGSLNERLLKVSVANHMSVSTIFPVNCPAAIICSAASYSSKGNTRSMSGC